MKRRRFVLVTLASLAAPRAAYAQSGRKIWRVGYLSGYTVEFDKPLAEAFLRGLRELGYVEGKNIVVDLRYAGGRPDQLPELAAELVRLKCDLFVVGGGDYVARAALKAGGTIPVVLANVSDPLGSGLIASLARPGGNVTGSSDFHFASVTKRLELLKEIVPSLSRVAVLMNPDNAANPPQVKTLQSAASALAVAIVPVAVRAPGEMERAFTTIAKERAGAFLVIGDAVFTNQQKRIGEFALKSRMPSIYTIRTYAEAGGLVSYGANFPELWRRAATYVDKILKGAKPGDLPIEQPTKFDLVINLRTAKALGIVIPRSVLLRADQVIE